jgi:hypothetical protein
MKHVARAFKILGLLFIAYIGYMIYAWNASVNEIESICSSIKMDDHFDGVEKTIANSRYARITGPFYYKGTMQVLIHSPSSFGRYTCDLELKNGKVSNVEFVYLD